jgi:hypothetical protein
MNKTFKIKLTKKNNYLIITRLLHHILIAYGVKPLIHQSELGTYTKVVPFQEKSSFHFVV